MIQVVTGVPVGHFPEETTVRIQDVVRPGPHLPHHLEHAPHPFVLFSKGIGTYLIPPTHPPASQVLPLPDQMQFPCPAKLLLGL